MSSLDGIHKRSKVWLHFCVSNFNSTTAKCNYCSKLLSFKNGNENNLRRHIKSAHPTVSINEDNPVYDTEVDDPAPLISNLDNRNEQNEPSMSLALVQVEL